MTSYAGNTTTTTPTIQTATSTQLLAANGFRKCLIIQNTSTGNVSIGLNGQTLTSIAASSTNPCYVLPSTAGSNVLRFTEGFVPAGAITVYQASGGPISTVVVTEG